MRSFCAKVTKVISGASKSRETALLWRDRATVKQVPALGSAVLIKMPVNIGSAVLVTGDTYEKKAKLLAVGRRPTSKGKAAQA